MSQMEELQKLHKEIATLQNQLTLITSMLNNADSLHRESVDVPFCERCPEVQCTFYGTQLEPPEYNCPACFEFGSDRCIAVKLFNDHLKVVEDDIRQLAEEYEEDKENGPYNG